MFFRNLTLFRFPTSMTFDAAGQLFVSSRFEGSIYRVSADGTHEAYASDLGIACGLCHIRQCLGQRRFGVIDVLQGVVEGFFKRFHDFIL